MRNKYSFSEFVSNAYALVLTKLFYRGARLIRRPIYMRGKSSLTFKKGFVTGHACRFDLVGGKEKTLFIGENCELGDNTHIVAHERVEIGNNVLVASKVFISDTNHGTYKGIEQDSPDTSPKERLLSTDSVYIGNNVWIGENVVILAGTYIGDGCIVGANSVVSGKFSNKVIIVGAPGKVIKTWNKDKGVWEK